MDMELFRQYVLSLMMTDVRFLAMAASVLKPMYFETTLEQHTARFILEHFRETKTTPDRTTLLHRASKYFKTLSKSGGKVSGVTFADVSELVDELEAIQEQAVNQYVYVKKELSDFCRLQALKDAIIASVSDIEKNDLSKLKQRVTSALSVGANLDNRGIFLFEDSADRRDVAEIRSPIPTGYKFIDGPSKGGLGRGEVGLIQAGPNTGKTTALVNIGAGCAKLGAKVAHITCEMKDVLIINAYERCWLKKTSSDMDDIGHEGREAITKFFKKVKKNIKSDVAVKEFQSGRLSLDELYGYLIMLESVHDFKPEVILLDYLDILAPPPHIKEKHEQQEYNLLEYRAMMQDLNTAGWTATQGGRGSLSKETSSLEDVAGGFLKGAHADIVITLNQNQQEQQDDILRAYWAKNRFGKKFVTYNLITDFDRSRLEPA